MQSQKQILTLLLISGASLLPLALPAVDNSISCYPLPSDGSVNSPSPQPVDVLRPEGLGLASIHLTPISTCRAGYFNTKGSEIVTYEPRTERLFVINQAQDTSLPPTLDVIDIHHPSSPLYLGSIDLSKSFQKESSQVRVLPTSVAVKRGIVAVAVHPDADTAPSPPLSGKVLFYNAGLPLAGQIQGQEVGLINMVTVGYTPDMLTRMCRSTPAWQQYSESLSAATGFIIQSSVLLYNVSKVPPVRCINFPPAGLYNLLVAVSARMLARYM